jgi:hypothetical protein
VGPQQEPGSPEIESLRDLPHAPREAGRRLAQRHHRPEPLPPPGELVPHEALGVHGGEGRGGEMAGEVVEGGHPVCISSGLSCVSSIPSASHRCSGKYTPTPPVRAVTVRARACFW